MRIFFTIPVCAIKIHTPASVSAAPTGLLSIASPKSALISPDTTPQSPIARRAFSLPDSSNSSALPPSRGRAGMRLYMLSARLIIAVRLKKLSCVETPKYAHRAANASPVTGPANIAASSALGVSSPLVSMQSPDESKRNERTFPPSSFTHSA